MFSNIYKTIREFFSLPNVEDALASVTKSLRKLEQAGDYHQEQADYFAAKANAALLAGSDHSDAMQKAQRVHSKLSDLIS